MQYSKVCRPDFADTRELAEFGVVFLVFSIGLEFSLTELATMRRPVFGLGASQVALTLCVVVVLAQAAGTHWRAREQRYNLFRGVTDEADGGGDETDAGLKKLRV